MQFSGNDAGASASEPEKCITGDGDEKIATRPGCMNF
jgi:hypothetical protein